MAINMLSSPCPICFPLYSIRSQQEARQIVLLFSSRPPYIHVSSFIIRSRSMLQKAWEFSSAGATTICPRGASISPGVGIIQTRYEKFV